VRAGILPEIWTAFYWLLQNRSHAHSLGLNNYRLTDFVKKFKTISRPVHRNTAAISNSTEDHNMLDINKATSGRYDAEGNMFGLGHWSPLFARRQAQAEGIFLTDEHWAIINYLRERYREHGDAKSAREIVIEAINRAGR
jgi:sulfur relay (sulfurtransferase) DsrC/TusE family protein